MDTIVVFSPAPGPSSASFSIARTDQNDSASLSTTSLTDDTATVTVDVGAAPGGDDTRNIVVMATLAKGLDPGLIAGTLGGQTMTLERFTRRNSENALAFWCASLATGTTAEFIYQNDAGMVNVSPGI